MIVRKFARPYARAILDVTGSPEKASQLRAELLRFEEMRRGSSDLHDLYANPGLDVNSKVAVTGQLASRLGLSAPAAKVLEVLVRNHRANDLGAILDALEFYVNKALGVVVAEVRSAHKLNDEEEKRLRDALEKKTGKKVELKTMLDANLIGGFVARIGSEIYDASVVAKINKIRSSIT